MGMEQVGRVGFQALAKVALNSEKAMSEIVKNPQLKAAFETTLKAIKSGAPNADELATNTMSLIKNSGLGKVFSQEARQVFIAPAADVKIGAVRDYLLSLIK